MIDKIQGQDSPVLESTTVSRASADVLDYGVGV